MNGLLLVDKPKGISSFDVIRRLRRIMANPAASSGFHERRPTLKIGHAGTLDPLASGLMLMLFGSACKQAGQFSKLDKSYAAEITLGSTSSTGDSEGMLTEQSNQRPSQRQVQSTLKFFVGDITQIPPVYSAIKIGGREAYKYARAGQAVEVPSRQVTITSIDLLEYKYPLIKLNADVSSGTYIRTLAEDIGEDLGTGAYLSGLVRTRVGEFELKDAVSLDGLQPDQVAASLIRLE